MKTPIVLLLLTWLASMISPRHAAASSEPPAGVEFAISHDEKSARIGDVAVFKLHCSNRGESPVRIYLVRSGPFRAGQSSLVVRRVADGTPVEIQPAPRPHGYVVSEADFHLIAPGRTMSDQQTLRISPEHFRPGEEYIVTWIYENHVTKWPGGSMTLDGPTKPLFGGKGIPFIWTGRSEVETRLRIAPVDSATSSGYPPAEVASIGTATMKDDGTIVLRLLAESREGHVGHGYFEYATSHPDYEKIRQHVGRMRPGDSVSVKPWPEEK